MRSEPNNLSLTWRTAPSRSASLVYLLRWYGPLAVHIMLTATFPLYDQYNPTCPPSASHQSQQHGSSRMQCPLSSHHKHGDAAPSLGIALNDAHGSIRLKCYLGNGCIKDALIAELRRRGLWWTVPQATGLTVAQLAAAKGFGTEYLATLVACSVRDGGSPILHVPSPAD